VVVVVVWMHRRFLESYRDKVDREMVSCNVVEMKVRTD
jgi:hypothetical protein